MVDTRFHTVATPDTLNALLGAVGFEPAAEDVRGRLLVIAGARELHIAGSEHISLAVHRDYAADLEATSAGAVIVSPALREHVPESSIAIVTPKAHELFVELLHRMYPADTRSVFSGALGVDQEPYLEAGVRIGANVSIGANVEIGSGTIIGPNTSIGAGVAIGRDCIIGSNCSIDCAYLGNKVVLHPGARIGTEGFGWLDFTLTNRKIPQLGRVILQDGVEIGANTTIDRGALGDTVIGEGTKIDNLVQVGHNCNIGRNCLIAGQVGLSGSTIIGDSVMIGGGAGTAGHLTIGAGSVIYARSGVTKDVPPKSHYAGAPAEDARTWRRNLASIRRLVSKEEG